MESHSSTGEPSIDRILGGLLPGDNVVWVGDRPSVHDRIERSFLSVGTGPKTLVLLDDDDAGVDDDVAVIDARPGRRAADPMVLESEILERGSIAGSRLVVRSLDTVVRRVGAEAALGLFTRTCPRMFDRGALAYWRASRTGAGAILDSVRRVTQCVVDHTGTRLRVVKAENRPGAAGRIFDLSIDDSTLVLQEVRARSRLAEGLRRLRVDRGLTQAEISRLADVSPSAISQAESGNRGLNLDTLLTLTEALNVSLDELLGHQPDPGYVVARRDRIPARRGVVPLLDGQTAGLRAHLVTLGPGETGGPGTVHKGAELVLVGNGVVQVVLNEETPVLRSGDALLVTHDAIHGWRNLLPEIARLFWIVRD
ncbi:MAG TPA: XRE family transcriptional regulator [Acidimicrobiia bacterium]|nr:XRE family transcriptional regulator [Acidimicrobiia bacterium]